MYMEFPVCCHDAMEISRVMKSNEIVLDKICVIKRYMELQCRKCKDVVYVKE